jgi:hypothetical protein
MRHYFVTIRWRGFKWELRGIARCSSDLVGGLVQYFGADTSITVRAA